MQLLIILFIIGIVLLLGNKNKNEGFHFRRQYGSFCNKCDGKTYNQCIECANCGICVLGNKKVKCTPGDMYGPYDSRLHCKLWFHNDENSRRLWKNKLKMVKPYA
tara:strand:- start:28125 stop:28439 length:315 start_codon:yes stop_codon:yes gene_type:complete